MERGDESAEDEDGGPALALAFLRRKLRMATPWSFREWLFPPLTPIPVEMLGAASSPTSGEAEAAAAAAAPAEGPAEPVWETLRPEVLAEGCSSELKPLSLEEEVVMEEVQGAVAPGEMLRLMWGPLRPPRRVKASPGAWARVASKV